MSLRLRCHECRTVFVSSNDQVGHSVSCPKCGASQVVAAPNAPLAGTGPTPDEPVAATAPIPRIKPAPAQEEPEASVFVPKEARPPGRRGRKGWWAALVLLAVAGVAVAIAWPAILRWWDPRPKTMVLGVAYDYLHALAGDKPEDAAKFGVVADPPAIRSFRNLRRDPARDAKVRGSFAPLAALHSRIEKKYTYDAPTGRFLPRDPLGPAAEVLDTLHEAKAKAEKDGTYTKMASGDPDEIFEAAEKYGSVFSKLSEGILAPKKLIPSYRMLVQDAKPPLPPAEKSLALDYARQRETWDALLGRPFPTLKADDDFIFEKAEVTADVQVRSGSAGDPPIPLRLKLVRFRIELAGIDTKWKVVSARRIRPGVPDEPEDEEGPDPNISPEPPSPSPGASPPSPGLDPALSPGRSPSGAGQKGGSPTSGEGMRP